MSRRRGTVGDLFRLTLVGGDPVGVFDDALVAAEPAGGGNTKLYIDNGASFDVQEAPTIVGKFFGLTPLFTRRVGGGSIVVYPWNISAARAEPGAGTGTDIHSVGGQVFEVTEAPLAVAAAITESPMSVVK